MTLTFTGGIATTGRLTANPQFTPGGPTDEFFSSVTLLMHMEDATDVIGNATSNTGVTFSAGQFANAGVFDGADFIDVTPSSGFDFATSDFTVECWVKTSSGAGFQEVLSNWKFSTGERSWLITMDSGKIQMAGSTDGGLGSNFRVGSTVITDGNWHHIAFVRSGNDYDFFIDGTLDISENGFGDLFSADNLTIGASPDPFAEKFIGSIDDIRITKGVARYTANFDVPTEEFLNQ